MHGAAAPPVQWVASCSGGHVATLPEVYLVIFARTLGLRVGRFASTFTHCLSEIHGQTSRCLSTMSHVLRML